MLNNPADYFNTMDDFGKNPEVEIPKEDVPKEPVGNGLVLEEIQEINSYGMGM